MKRYKVVILFVCLLALMFVGFISRNHSTTSGVDLGITILVAITYMSVVGVIIWIFTDPPNSHKRKSKRHE